MENRCQGDVVIIGQGVAEFSEDAVVLYGQLPSGNGEIVDGAVSSLECIGKEVVGDKKPELVLHDGAAEVEVEVVIGEFIGFADNGQLVLAGGLEILILEKQREFP